MLFFPTGRINSQDLNQKTRCYISNAIEDKSLQVIFNSNLESISDKVDYIKC